MQSDLMNDALLPGLPKERILARYRAAPGNEIESGKFASPESSAALVANTFGFFLERATELPPLPKTEDLSWPAQRIYLEETVRFPWAGGRHPCLDVLIETRSTVIGIESKRFEPFRTKKTRPMSDAYWREVWGTRMSAYERCRDRLKRESSAFSRVDAVQLVKHAFGLRTLVNRKIGWQGKRPVLYYLYAEPKNWPGERGIVPAEHHRTHRAQIAEFAEAIAGDKVEFRSCSYGQLLSDWSEHPSESVRAHAAAVAQRFMLSC